MNFDLAVTIYALNRVLHHLSEEEQAKGVRPAVYMRGYQSRAEARCIIKRKLAAVEGNVAILWRLQKGSAQ